MGRFSLYFFVIFSSLSFAEPTLYLDGKNLANKVTPWVLDNTAPQARMERQSISELRPRLHDAIAIFPTYDNRRVALRRWISEQQDSSILPHQLILKAIEIAHGNVQDGISLCWDELRDNNNDNADLRNGNRTALKPGGLFYPGRAPRTLGRTSDHTTEG